MGKRPGTLSPARLEPDEAAVSTGRSRRHHLWVMGAVLIVVVGVVGSVFAADSVAHNDADRSQLAFERSSSEISSTLQLAIQHQDDLVVDTSGFILANPNASEADFREWAATVHVLDRYPEILGFGFAVIVPASELPAFIERVKVDPPGTLSADGSVQIIPPGDRPTYCLLQLGIVRTQLLSNPAGTDFCATGQTGVSSQDSGQSAYVPYSFGDLHLLTVNVPVYRGGVVPATVEQRREAFLGWLGTGSVPKVLLDRALQGHPGTAVAFRYRDAASDVVFTSGTVPRGAHTVTIDLQNGWTVQTFASVTSRGLLTNSGARGLLVVGVALSAVLALFVLMLATGRARALRLVRERTGELRHQALHDPLTGLPNRALIMDRIDQLLARNRRHRTAGAALFVDLDEFKNVNDTLGHEAGDRLLVAVAARLESTLRDADTIGRMGGDEFVILVDGGDLKAAPELVAERLLNVMRQPFELDGASMPLIVNTSIGIAVGDRASGGDLLRDADVALYQAKAAGKNRFEIFRPEMQADVTHRLVLEFDLRSALECEQFRLVYQPIYNLDDLTVVGVEALLRWDHPTLGTIGPDEFVPILEQTGQIREVGQWVLHRACRQMAAWHARGDTLDISVNVSARQLDNDAVVGHITDALRASGLSATSLIIEVTETALMRNPDATAERLRAIKALGVRIAVDDFGTGYSSLAYLQRFPVDCLKIDRMFTSAISTSPESRALIGTLVQLGKDLGLETLAEGIETTDEMDHLRGEHVGQAQGFLFARPLDPQTLEDQILQPARDTAPDTKHSN